jgi:hypothetical protein
MFEDDRVGDAVGATLGTVIRLVGVNVSTVVGIMVGNRLIVGSQDAVGKFDGAGVFAAMIVCYFLLFVGILLLSVYSLFLLLMSPQAALISTR